MGWRDRDYAKWTDEERRRFYGSSGSVRSDTRAFDDYGAPQHATTNRLFRRGVGPAIFLSAAVFALGHFPTSRPLVPSLGFTLPGFSRTSPGSIRPTGTVNTPSMANVGSTLTFHGTAPSGNAPVAVEGSYDGGQTWQTLSSVGSANGSYAAEVTLTRRGPLDIQIVFSDGSKAVGSLVVK